jgi:hypothetical protein
MKPELAEECRVLQAAHAVLLQEEHARVSHQGHAAAALVEHAKKLTAHRAHRQDFARRLHESHAHTARQEQFYPEAMAHPDPVQQTERLVRAQAVVKRRR